VLVPRLTEFVTLNILKIYIIRATLLVRLAKKPEYTVFTIIIANIKKALVLKKYTNPTIKVLVEYYKYLNALLYKEANKLLEY
jgi:hypothetical protein